MGLPCFFPGTLSPLCFSLKHGPGPEAPWGSSALLDPASQPSLLPNVVLTFLCPGSRSLSPVPALVCLPEGLPEAAFVPYSPAGWGFLSQWAKESERVGRLAGGLPRAHIQSKHLRLLAWPTPSLQPGWAWPGRATWSGRYVGETAVRGAGAWYPHSPGPWHCSCPLPVALLLPVPLSSGLSPALFSGSLVLKSSAAAICRKGQS